MKLSIQREELLKPLQLLVNVVEKRQALPILSNLLLKIDNNGLSITATDLEAELIIKLPFPQPIPYEITVPAHKLMDICRSLPENALINLTSRDNKLFVQSGKSRFILSTLPATEYPSLEAKKHENILEFTMEQKDLRFLIQRTSFAMAQQDVRYYLNGMLLEVNQGIIRTVATDGHRLALNSIDALVINNSLTQVIIPRKGVLELLKLLNDSSEEVVVSIMTNHLKVSNSFFDFTSKLIEGGFPNYDRVIPKGGDKMVSLPRELLKGVLTRVSILSNEKFRGIQLQLRQGLLRVLANNPDTEEAEEEIKIDYSDIAIDIDFNVKYLTDICDALDDEMLTMTFKDGDTSILVAGNKHEGDSLFVVMPMRL